MTRMLSGACELCRSLRRTVSRERRSLNLLGRLLGNLRLGILLRGILLLRCTADSLRGNLRQADGLQNPRNDVLWSDFVGESVVRQDKTVAQYVRDYLKDVLRDHIIAATDERKGT